MQALIQGGLGRNAWLALLQSLVSIVCLFIAYRLLISQQGLAALGLWSLLMIFGGVASNLDVSGASALARTVARRDHEFADASPAQVVHTVLLTSIAINSAIAAALLLLATPLLPQIVAADQIAEAWTLFPWVAALIILTPLSTGVCAALDGLMRADLRATLVIAASLIALLFGLFAIPQFGVRGFAMMQLLQLCLTIVGGWLLLRQRIDHLGWAPVQWSAAVAKRTTGYAVRLNLTGALGLLLEPLAKFCINAAGGATAVGVYELAARLAVQLRSLVVSAAMPLLPVFAQHNSGADEEMGAMLAKAQSVVRFAAIGVACASIVGAPLMSLVILGHLSADVLLWNAILACGWSINILALPFYVAAQGQGILRWNLLSHAVIGTIVALSSITLAPIYGSTGIVLGMMIGLLMGTAVVVVGNARLFGQGAVLRREFWPTAFACLLIGTVCAACFGYLTVFGIAEAVR